MSGNGQKRKRDTKDVGSRSEGEDSDDSDQDGLPQGCSWWCCQWWRARQQRRAEKKAAAQTLAPNDEGDDAVADGEGQNGDGNSERGAVEGRPQRHNRPPHRRSKGVNPAPESSKGKLAIDTCGDGVEKQDFGLCIYIVDREEFEVAINTVQGLTEPDWERENPRVPLYFADRPGFEAAGRAVQDLRNIRSIEQLNRESASQRERMTRSNIENSGSRRAETPRRKREAKDPARNRGSGGFRVRPRSPTPSNALDDSLVNSSSIMDEPSDTNGRSQRRSSRSRTSTPPHGKPVAARLRQIDSPDVQARRSRQTQLPLQDDGKPDKQIRAVGDISSKSPLPPIRELPRPLTGEARNKPFKKGTRAPALGAGSRRGPKAPAPAPKPKAVPLATLIKALPTLQQTQYGGEELSKVRPLTPDIVERKTYLKEWKERKAVQDAIIAGEQAKLNSLKRPRPGSRDDTSPPIRRQKDENSDETESADAGGNGSTQVRPPKRRMYSRPSLDVTQSQGTQSPVKNSAATFPPSIRPPPALPPVTPSPVLHTPSAPVAAPPREMSENAKRHHQNLDNAARFLSEGGSPFDIRPLVGNSVSSRIESKSQSSAECKSQQELASGNGWEQVQPGRETPSRVAVNETVQDPDPKKAGSSTTALAAPETGIEPIQPSLSSISNGSLRKSVDGLRERYGDERNWPEDLKREVFDGISSPKSGKHRPLGAPEQPQTPSTESYRPVPRSTNVFDQSYTDGVTPRPKGPELFRRDDRDPETISTPAPVATDTLYPPLNAPLPSQPDTSHGEKTGVNEEEDVSLEDIMTPEDFTEMLNDLLQQREGQLRTKGLSKQEIDRQVKKTQHEVYNRVASLKKRSQFVEIFDNLNKMDWVGEGGGEEGPSHTGTGIFTVLGDSPSGHSEVDSHNETRPQKNEEAVHRQQYRRNHQSMLEREYPDATDRRNFTRSLHMYARHLRDYKNVTQFLDDMANYHPVEVAALRRAQATEDRDDLNYSLAWRVAMIVEGRTVAPYIDGVHHAYFDEELWDDDSEDEDNPNVGLLGEGDDEFVEEGIVGGDDGADDGADDEGNDGADDGGDDFDNDDFDDRGDDDRDLSPPPAVSQEPKSQQSDDSSSSPAPLPSGFEISTAPDQNNRQQQLDTPRNPNQADQHQVAPSINPFTGKGIDPPSTLPLFGRGSVAPDIGVFGEYAKLRQGQRNDTAQDHEKKEPKLGSETGDSRGFGGSNGHGVHERTGTTRRSPASAIGTGSEGSGSYRGSLGVNPSRGRGRSRVPDQGRVPSNVWVPEHLRPSPGTNHGNVMPRGRSGSVPGHGGTGQPRATNQGDGRPFSPNSASFIKLGEKKQGLRRKGVDIKGDNEHKIEHKWRAHGCPLPGGVQASATQIGGTLSTEPTIPRSGDRSGPQTTTPLGYTPMKEMKDALKKAGVYYGKTSSELKEAYAKLLHDGPQSDSASVRGQPGRTTDRLTPRQPTSASSNGYDAHPSHLSPQTGPGDRKARPGQARQDTSGSPDDSGGEEPIIPEHMKLYLTANRVYFDPKIPNGQLIKLFEATRTRVNKKFDKRWGPTLRLGGTDHDSPRQIRPSNDQRTSSDGRATIAPPSLGPNEMMDFLDEHGAFYPRKREPAVLYSIYQDVKAGRKFKRREGAPPERVAGNSNSRNEREGSTCPATPSSTRPDTRPDTRPEEEPSLESMLTYLDQHGGGMPNHLSGSRSAVSNMYNIYKMREQLKEMDKSEEGMSQEDRSPPMDRRDADHRSDDNFTRSHGTGNGYGQSGDDLRESTESHNGEGEITSNGRNRTPAGRDRRGGYRGRGDQGTGHQGWEPRGSGYQGGKDVFSGPSPLGNGSARRRTDRDNYTPNPRGGHSGAGYQGSGNRGARNSGRGRGAWLQGSGSGRNTPVMVDLEGDISMDSPNRRTPSQAPRGPRANGYRNGTETQGDRYSQNNNNWDSTPQGRLGNDGGSFGSSGLKKDAKQFDPQESRTPAPRKPPRQSRDVWTRDSPYQLRSRANRDNGGGFEVNRTGADGRRGGRGGTVDGRWQRGGTPGSHHTPRVDSEGDLAMSGADTGSEYGGSGVRGGRGGRGGRGSRGNRGGRGGGRAGHKGSGSHDRDGDIDMDSSGPRGRGDWRVRGSARGDRDSDIGRGRGRGATDRDGDFNMDGGGPKGRGGRSSRGRKPRRAGAKGRGAKRGNGNGDVEMGEGRRGNGGPRGYDDGGIIIESAEQSRACLISHHLAYDISDLETPSSPETIPSPLPSGHSTAVKPSPILLAFTTVDPAEKDAHLEDEFAATSATRSPDDSSSQKSLRTRTSPYRGRGTPKRHKRRSISEEDFVPSSSDSASSPSPERTSRSVSKEEKAVLLSSQQRLARSRKYSDLPPDFEAKIPSSPPVSSRTRARFIDAEGKDGGAFGLPSSPPNSSRTRSRFRDAGREQDGDDEIALGATFSGSKVRRRLDFGMKT